MVGQDKERSHATSSARLPTMASSTRCFIEARVLASALQSRTFRGRGRGRGRARARAKVRVRVRARVACSRARLGVTLTLTLTLTPNQG